MHCEQNIFKDTRKIIHLIHIDDIKVFAWNEKEQETLIQTISIYSKDIKMAFCIGN